MADGCVVRHSVVVYDRGGSRRVTPLVDLTEVKYERRLSAVSKAHVLLLGHACDQQAQALRSIHARRHELVIFRGDERVWEGPITQVKWTGDGVRIDASDVTEYLFGTPLSRD